MKSTLKEEALKVLKAKIAKEFPILDWETKENHNIRLERELRLATLQAERKAADTELFILYDKFNRATKKFDKLNHKMRPEIVKMYETRIRAVSSKLNNNINEAMIQFKKHCEYYKSHVATFYNKVEGMSAEWEHRTEEDFKKIDAIGQQWKKEIEDGIQTVFE